MELNLSPLKDLLESNESVAEVLEIFVRTAKKEYDRLLEAFDKKDWQIVSSSGHTLKSKFKYVGINEEAEIAKNIEYFAKDSSNLGKLPNEVERLKEVFDPIITTVEKAIHDLKA